MSARDHFLMELYRRTEGRTDRTVHARLHIAKPLHLSELEARSAIAALRRDGLIAADPMYDRLVWLTAAGVAACERQATTDVVLREPGANDTYVPLVALRGAYADIGAAAGERELVAQ